MQTSDNSAEIPTTTDPLLANLDHQSQEQDEMRVELAEKKLRWGVIEILTDPQNENDRSAIQVQYLGFGVEEDGVTTPKIDVLYA